MVSLNQAIIHPRLSIESKGERLSRDGTARLIWMIDYRKMVARHPKCLFQTIQPTARMINLDELHTAGIEVYD